MQHSQGVSVSGVKSIASEKRYVRKQVAQVPVLSPPYDQGRARLLSGLGGGV
jgi:hypothetical protein